MERPCSSVGGTMVVLARRSAFLVVGLAGTAFIAAVYTYANYGAPWVDRLEQNVGEVVSARAVALARAGRTEEAVDAYRQALAASFDNPELYKWRAGELAALLVEQRRYDEALDTAIDLLDHDARAAMAAFREIHQALRDSAANDTGLRLSQRWAAAANERNERAAEALGLLYTALSLRGLDRPAEAADFALRAFAADPSMETASVGARILRDTNRLESGIEVVRYFLDHAEGDLRDEARTIAAKVPRLAAGSAAP